MNTDIREEIIALLSKLGPGKMSPSAYDTAWVARLGDIDPELSGRALEWLCRHQLPDGSWGAEQPFYYHDRVISTLSAMIALASQKNRRGLRRQIEKGLVALEWITERATKGLLADPNGATVGFEMIVPTLVSEAEKLGLIKQQGERILGRIARLRKSKLEKIQGRKINRYVTMAFSAEMAGTDFQDLLDVENLQEANGSVGHSPSATAYFAKFVRPADPGAVKYLKWVVSADGSVPDLLPFDVYERAWVLWNLALIGDQEITQSLDFQRHLQHLRTGWDARRGIGLSTEYSVPDGDNTSVTFDLLTQFGFLVDIQGLMSFDSKELFRCYELEADPSISVNIHALNALRHAGYEPTHPLVRKVLSLLRRMMTNEGYWFDKWQISPYYTTAHAIIACKGYYDEMIMPSIQWILNTQNTQGGWGYYGPTPEETSYCLQALCLHGKQNGSIHKDAIQKGFKWLNENRDTPPHLFWIGKGLYAGEYIVRSSILSALELTSRI